MKSLAYAGLTLALVFIAFWGPSPEATVAAVVALILGPLLIFMATRQAKALRHEYRYAGDSHSHPNRWASVPVEESAIARA